MNGLKGRENQPRTKFLVTASQTTIMKVGLIINHTQRSGY